MDEATTTELIVIRHGVTEWNQKGIMQGHMDPPLSELGYRQAQALARRMEAENIAALYSSDLQRAKQTAEPIAHATGCEIQIDRRIRERNIGVLQGLRWREAMEKHPEIVEQLLKGDPLYTIPGGESWKHTFERVKSFLQDILARHTGEKIAIVTHGGILNCLFRLVVGLPPGRFRGLRIPNASFNRFEYHDDHWFLVVWGDTCHLASIQ